MAGTNYLPQMKKLSEQVVHYEDDEMARELPALYQLLCHARDSAGNWRKGATLMLFADDGKLKATLHDPATGQVWFCTLNGYIRLVEQVESLLEAGKGDWRAKRGK